MIRIGIVGTNWISDRLIEASKGINAFHFKALYSRTAEKARKFGEKYDVDLIFTNLNEMAKSSEIDAVYLATPNILHKEQAILFMKNGKHVLCEKPLATNSKDVKEMFEAASEHKVLLMEAMKSTFLPNFQIVLDNLYKIGHVRKYIANCCKYSSRYDQFKKGNILNAFRPELGNGSLMDLGVYGIYPLVVLFGKPKKISASAIKLSNGVDGGGNILINYEDMDGIISHSKISTSYLPTEIQGEKGTILIDKIQSPQKVTIHYKSGFIEDLTVKQHHPTMYYETKEFIHLIKTGQTESTLNSFEHSFLTMNITDAVRKQLGITFMENRL